MMDYAVIGTGGKQVRAMQGAEATVERLPGNVGHEVIFHDVRLLRRGETVSVGNPTVPGASVKATILAQVRAKKIVVFKIKRRKNYRKTQGHRQYLTRVRFDEIAGP